MGSVAVGLSQEWNQLLCELPVSPTLPLVLLLADCRIHRHIPCLTHPSLPTLSHHVPYPVPAIRRSQARASSRPPPKANPSIAAMVGAGKAAVERKKDSACESLAGPGQGLRVGERLAGWDRGPHWSQVWGPYLVPQPSYFRSWLSHWGKLWDQLGNQSGQVGWMIPYSGPQLLLATLGLSSSLFFVPSPVLGAGNTEFN